MTTPTSRGAYKPYYEVMDRALDSLHGVRIAFSEAGEAYQYRVRLHTARKLDRALSRVTHEPGHQLYDISDYDVLVVRIIQDGDCWWVNIERAEKPRVIEELTA